MQVGDFLASIFFLVIRNYAFNYVMNKCIGKYANI